MAFGFVRSVVVMLAVSSLSSLVSGPVRAESMIVIAKNTIQISIVCLMVRDNIRPNTLIHRMSGIKTRKKRKKEEKIWGKRTKNVPT